MKHRLVSLAIAGVMLLSVGGAVSAAPTNENAVEASCHGQSVALQATTGNQPGRSGAESVKAWHDHIKFTCSMG